MWSSWPARQHASSHADGQTETETVRQPASQAAEQADRHKQIRTLWRPACQHACSKQATHQQASHPPPPATCTFTPWHGTGIATGLSLTATATQAWRRVLSRSLRYHVRWTPAAQATGQASTAQRGVVCYVYRTLYCRVRYRLYSGIYTDYCMYVLCMTYRVSRYSSYVRLKYHDQLGLRQTYARSVPSLLTAHSLPNFSHRTCINTSELGDACVLSW